MPFKPKKEEEKNKTVRSDFNVFVCALLHQNRKFTFIRYTIKNRAISFFDSIAISVEKELKIQFKAHK